MAAYLLLPRPISFGLSAPQAWRLKERELAAFYIAMIAMLDERRRSNLPRIDRLRLAFTVMLCGMLVAVCGLVTAIAVA